MPLDLVPLDLSQLSPVVAKVVGAATQGPAKMMAARGLVPMGPRDLVTALYQLSLDADPRIGDAAKGTAEGLPDNILAAALGDAIEPLVLHFFASRVLDRPALVEKLLLNRGAHDETLIYLAQNLGELELELLASNQERLLRCPPIIEALYFNKQARMSTVERLLEMAVRNGLALDRIPEFKEIAAGILGAKAPASEEPSGSALDEEFKEAMSWEEGPVGELEYQEEEAPEEKTVSLLNMSLTTKIRLATIGSAMHRNVLIRDSNRTVAMAAIKSPAVSEQEAARYAANRSLSDDVIRYIAHRKEWQKSYVVKLNLVNNPKCPLSVSMGYLVHLRVNDLRALVRSKNIPSALAKAAKENLRKRGP